MKNIISNIYFDNKKEYVRLLDNYIRGEFYVVKRRRIHRI